MKSSTTLFLAAAAMTGLIAGSANRAQASTLPQSGRSQSIKKVAAHDAAKAGVNFIDDSAFPMLILALAIFAFGPGRASLDHVLKRRVFDRHPAAAPSVDGRLDEISMSNDRLRYAGG